MSTIDRLTYFLDFSGVKRTALEREIGLGNGYLGKMERRKASVGSDILEKIVSYFPKLNSNWLLRGDDPMLLEQGNNVSEPAAVYRLKDSGPCQQCDLRERLLSAQEETITQLKLRLSDLEKRK